MMRLKMFISFLCMFLVLLQSTQAQQSENVNCTEADIKFIEDEMAINPRKAQCDSLVPGNEMYKLDDPTIICDLVPCKLALNDLYNVLPNCSFNGDFNVWNMTNMLLRNCGITPTNTTEENSTSSTSSSGNTDNKTPVPTTTASEQDKNSTPEPTNHCEILSSSSKLLSIMLSLFAFVVAI